MLPFQIQIKLGEPITEQIVFAVKKAIVSGQLRAGDRFPAVRQLSVALKINPNTAHKAVAILIQEGLLVSAPGVGCFVTKLETATRRERSDLLNRELEQVVVEAKKMGVSLDELTDALKKHWKLLNEDEK